MSYIAVPSDRILHLQDLELGVLIHYVIVSTSVHRFGVHSIVGWNSRPGKARQAAGTQPWRRSREASAQGTVCIPGRPDAFRKRYATLSSQRSGGKQTTRQESD